MKDMTRRGRLAVFALMVLTLFLLTGCEDGGRAVRTGGTIRDGSPEAGAGTLKVHFIDVGQGDSILVESGGQFLLIDAGENDQGSVVSNYLKSQGVERLEYVVGTHPHSDHIGGLDTVIREFETGKVILPPKEHTTKTFEDVLDAVEEGGLKITKAQAGNIYQLGEAEFEMLAPVKDYGDDLNNWSAGIRLTFGENHFVFTGDAEAAAEADICASNPRLSADVLKVGHHGSSTSTSEEFLRAVNPSFAVISCGRDNSYGHPHKEVTDLLDQNQVETYRTDLLGTIVAVSDGKQISWYIGNEVEKAAEVTTENTSKAYVVNTNTKKFHRAECPYADEIKEKNREYFEGSKEDLENEGYVPCKSCKP